MSSIGQLSSKAQKTKLIYHFKAAFELILSEIIGLHFMDHAIILKYLKVSNSIYQCIL